jgi:hypothetical protein
MFLAKPEMQEHFWLKRAFALDLIELRWKPLCSLPLQGDSLEALDKSIVALAAVWAYRNEHRYLLLWTKQPRSA